MTRKLLISISVVIGVLVVAGIGVLVWWLVTNNDADGYETILLEGDGLGETNYTAAFTRIFGAGDVFWWFFPTSSSSPRPILLFLGGITGIPPSFLLNFGEIGPLDFNLNARNNSLVNEYNLLFVDSIIGTGFSSVQNRRSVADDIDDIVDNVMYTLQSFYEHHTEYEDAPLYIYEQGDGSLIAVPLTLRLANDENFSHKIKGVFLGNPIISPAVTLTKLGFYLEEMAYIDGNGRIAIEDFSNTMTALVSQRELEAAFDQFFSIGDFINEKAGAVAVNLGHIVEKLTKQSVRDYFGQSAYFDRIIPSYINMKSYMQNVIAPVLGISSGIEYDRSREDVIRALRPIYMESISDKVEYILNSTNVTVTIFNGNLDAVSNTPGQLEWIHNLNWPGQPNFTGSRRNTLIINRQVEGYFRESNRLNFYWIHVAGQSTILDNPAAVRKMLERVTRSN